MTREQYDDYIRNLQEQIKEDTTYARRASTVDAWRIGARLGVVK